MVNALVKKARLSPATFDVSLPDIYHARKRQGQLRADPTVLALPRCGPAHFYLTGSHLLWFSTLIDAKDTSIEVKAEEELGPVLVEVLTRRFRLKKTQQSSRCTWCAWVSVADTFWTALSMPRNVTPRSTWPSSTWWRGSCMTSAKGQDSNSWIGWQEKLTSLAPLPWSVETESAKVMSWTDPESPHKFLIVYVRLIL